MRTPPRRASRNSGSGFGKRIKVAKKPFSPEPAEKKRKENKSASAGSRDGDGDGKKSRRGRATGQGRRRNGKAKDDEPVNKYGVCKNRIHAQLSTIRREQHHIDAYEMDGWKGASREKLRPADEIRKSQVKIFNCKLKVRDMFRDIDMDNGEVSFRDRIEEDTGEVDVEDVVCARCLDGDATDENDILICDGYCDRAFHQRCVVPPVKADEIPDEWLCPLCDARVDCFYTLNADFDLELDAADASWRDVFPTEAELDSKREGPGQENERRAEDSRGTKGLLDEDWGSDESGDEDFAEGADGDDGDDDDDEPLSGSARSGSDSDSDGDSGERRRVRDAMNAEAEVCVGKRRRTAVDYRKLNDEMFGEGEAFEGEAEDERVGGWGPSSPGRSKDAAAKRGRRGEGRSRRRSSATDAESRGAAGGSKVRVNPKPSTPASPRRKQSPAKKRTGAPPPKKFSDSVRAALEASFNANNFPSHHEMASIGGSIGLTDHQVKVWFQNRRRPKKPRAAEQNGTPAKSP